MKKWTSRQVDEKIDIDTMAVMDRAETLANILIIIKAKRWHFMAMAKKGDECVSFTGTEGQVKELFKRMSLEARDMEGEL